MVATTSMDAMTWFRKQVEAADGDLLRQMITSFGRRPLRCPVR